MKDTLTKRVLSLLKEGKKDTEAANFSITLALC